LHRRYLARFETPKGRIQVTPGTTFFPGTEFMGFDVASCLRK
jgi:hypothetical protein